MKKTHKIAVLGLGFLFMLLFDVAPQLVPDAHAVLGTRRRTARRTAAVVHSADSAAAQQQQAAPPPAEEPAPAPAPAPAAPPPAPAPAPAAGALPLGTIVNTLPEGCPQQAINGVQYYSCGGNYYRAAFQGSQLVYITAQP